MKYELNEADVSTLKYLLTNAINLTQNNCPEVSAGLMAIRLKFDRPESPTVSETVRQRDARRRATSFGFNQEQEGGN